MTNFWRRPGTARMGDLFRRSVAAAAIAEARAEDIVCIAGKGHEQGQVVGRGDTMRVIPFDDAAVSREAVAEIERTTGALA